MKKILLFLMMFASPCYAGDKDLATRYPSGTPMAVTVPGDIKNLTGYKNFSTNETGDIVAPTVNLTTNQLQVNASTDGNITVYGTGSGNFTLYNQNNYSISLVIDPNLTQNVKCTMYQNGTFACN